MDIYASSREVGVRPRGPGQVVMMVMVVMVMMVMVMVMVVMMVMVVVPVGHNALQIVVVPLLNHFIDFVVSRTRATGSSTAQSRRSGRRAQNTGLRSLLEALDRQ